MPRARSRRIAGPRGDRTPPDATGRDQARPPRPGAAPAAPRPHRRRPTRRRPASHGPPAPVGAARGYCANGTRRAASAAPPPRPAEVGMYRTARTTGRASGAAAALCAAWAAAWAAGAPARLPAQQPRQPVARAAALHPSSPHTVRSHSSPARRPPAAAQAPAPQVRTAHGLVAGLVAPSGVRMFRGIPFAAPPVGDLRWRPPQPVRSWTGVRPADRFAYQCMQARVFGDMMFRNAGMSEDCLYLNVWQPPAAARARRCPCSSTSTAAASWPATAPSRATTARAWRGAASWSSRSATGSACSVLRAPRAHGRVAGARVGQLRAHGPGGRAPVGAGERRRVRRGPAAGDDRGRVGGSFSVSAQMASPLGRGSSRAPSARAAPSSRRRSAPRRAPTWSGPG
jgi:hypothetical protein